MKTLFLPVLIALSLPAFAGLATPSDEKAVLAAEKQYIDGMVKSDPANVAKVLADDLSYTHSSSKIQNKAEVLEGITGKVQYTSITIESTKVRQYGNTVITSHNMMYTGPKVSSHVYVTMVWVKQAGGWQMVQRQATKLPQQ
jgi:ketosteroid isomerase-like protein